MTKVSNANWKTYRFDRMAVEIKDRVKVPRESRFDRYVGLTHLDAGSLKIWRWGSTRDVEKQKMLFKSGDIIFGRRNAYLRRVSVADFDGVCSAHAMVLRARPEVALPEFLPFFMQTETFWQTALRNSAGSLSPTINWSNIAKEEFALPPLDEQRRIAEVLQAAEVGSDRLLMAKNEAFCLWRSLSMEEFGSRAGKGGPLIDHYTITSGQVDPKKTEYAKLPLIAPNHMTSGNGIITEIVSARDQKAISGKYLYGEGVVLYSKIRPELRKAAIAPCQGLCSADMYPLIPNEELRSLYLLEILLSDSFSRFAVSGSTRTGMPKVNRKHLSAFLFRLPSLDEQDGYLALTQELHKSMAGLSLRSKQMGHLKSAILAKVGQNDI